MLAYIDYAFIVVFFVVLFGLALWIAGPHEEAVASTSTRPKSCRHRGRISWRMAFLQRCLSCFLS